MNKLYITKVLPDGYGFGKMPTKWEEPKEWHDGLLNKYYIDEAKQWEKYLASLPTFLVHPSLNPKEGAWIEQWREGFETVGFHGDWHECSKSRYDSGIDDYRRKVLLPLVKNKKDGMINKHLNKIKQLGFYYELVHLLELQREQCLKSIMDTDFYRKHSNDFPKSYITTAKTPDELEQWKEFNPTPPEGNTPASEILDMHIYHAGGYRINGVENKQGGVDFFKNGWPQVYNACISAMKEYASRKVLAYAQSKNDEHEYSKVKCDLCNYTWIAVRPTGVDKLECPKCNNICHFENI